MTDETRLELVAHGVRWASNILHEVASNHKPVLNDQQLHLLLTAMSCLHDIFTPQVRDGRRPSKP